MLHLKQKAHFYLKLSKMHKIIIPFAQRGVQTNKILMEVIEYDKKDPTARVEGADWT